MSGEGWTADTPESIQYVKLLALAHGLAFEINNPPMRWTRWPLTTVCKREGISNKRSKRGCLVDVVALLRTGDASYEPFPQIARALTKQ